MGCLRQTYGHAGCSGNAVERMRSWSRWWLLLPLLTAPGQIPRGGPDMSQIWVNLRTPARDNPSTARFPESVLLALLVFGIAMVIIVMALLAGWFALA